MLTRTWRTCLRTLGPGVLFLLVLLLIQVVAEADEPDPRETDPEASERLRALEERVRELERARAENHGEPGPDEEDADETPDADEAPGGRRTRLIDVVRSLGIGTRLRGGVVVSWSSSLQGLDGHVGARPLRVLDPDDDQIQLDVATVIAEREVAGPGDLGFRVALAAGRTPDLLDRDPTVGSPSDHLGVPEAWGAYALPWLGGPELRAGIVESFFGNETWFSPDNPTISRGLLFGFGGPRRLLALELAVPLPGGLRYTQVVANGWDRIVEDNDGKTLGGHLDVPTPADGRLRLGWLAGPEQPGRTEPVRTAVDVALEQPLLPGVLDLTADLRAGHEDDRPIGADVRDAVWYGASLTLAGRVDVGRVALRGEWFRDEDGAILPVGGPRLDVGSVTLTAGVVLLDHLSLRAEWRHDEADQDLFGPTDGRRRRDTLSLEMAATF